MYSPGEMRNVADSTFERFVDKSKGKGRAIPDMGGAPRLCSVNDFVDQTRKVGVNRWP